MNRFWLDVGGTAAVLIMFLAGLQSAAAIQIKHPAGGRIQAPYTVNSIHSTLAGIHVLAMGV